MMMEQAYKDEHTHSTLYKELIVTDERKGTQQRIVAMLLARATTEKCAGLMRTQRKKFKFYMGRSRKASQKKHPVGSI